MNVTKRGFHQIETEPFLQVADRSFRPHRGLLSFGALRNQMGP